MPRGEDDRRIWTTAVVQVHLDDRGRPGKCTEHDFNDLETRDSKATLLILQYKLQMWQATTILAYPSHRLHFGIRLRCNGSMNVAHVSIRGVGL